MLAQISLTPTESKKLIAKAVVKMDVVTKAVEQGIMALHPSSSTYFIVEEIMGRKPETDVWVCGVIVPKGSCVEMGSLAGGHAKTQQKTGQGVGVRKPEAFPHTWVIRDGKLATGIHLGDLLAEMGNMDVYVKGVNALDTQGNVGVLWGNVLEGGTFGKVMAASKRNAFSVVFPVGLEKLIPISVQEAAREANRHGYDYCTGVPCGLYPARGITVTEVDAVKILSGARAFPISAGGLGGAEGSITLVIKGEKAQVNKAIEYVEASKGAKLPRVRLYDCHECPAAICDFPVTDKPWVC